MNSKVFSMAVNDGKRVQDEEDTRSDRGVILLTEQRILKTREQSGSPKDGNQIYTLTWHIDSQFPSGLKK